MAQSRAHAAARRGAPPRDLTAELRRIVPQGVDPPAEIPPAVFAAAVDSFASGQRLDMQALARRASVSRATLYRQVVNREHLLDEVVWWRSRNALVEAVNRSAGLDGADRIVSTVGGMLRAIERDTSLHTFLETDPEAALRILTGTRSTVQRGLGRALETIIVIEDEGGHFHTELPAETLAYAIVQIAEAFVYADIIADRPPDVATALTVIEALLHGLRRQAPATSRDRPPGGHN